MKTVYYEYVFVYNQWPLDGSMQLSTWWEKLLFTNCNLLSLQIRVTLETVSSVTLWFAMVDKNKWGVTLHAGGQKKLLYRHQVIVRREKTCEQTHTQRRVCKNHEIGLSAQLGPKVWGEVCDGLKKGGNVSRGMQGRRRERHKEENVLFQQP